MHERRFHGDAERLRSADRLARLEVPRVVALSIENLAIKTVLDVGTGTAVFAEAFSERRLEVSGVDVNPAMIDLARRHVPGARFEVAPAEAIPFPDKTFDLVFLAHVLHEVDDTQKALDEAKRLAKLRVVVLEWPYRVEEHGPPLEHRLKADDVEGLFRATGFRSFERITLTSMDLYRIEP
jgi:ubiquinone/menaquinone biosynthesis C-methylase UbiE